MTIEQALNVALSHHQAGRLQEARDISLQILRQKPDEPFALHLLGTLNHQAGNTREGIKLVERAIALRRDPAFMANLGELLRADGQVERGIAVCRQVTQEAPNFATGYENLAALLDQAGRPAEALAPAQKAVSLAPRDASGHRILGTVLANLKQFPLAQAELETAININARDPISWMTLGLVHEAQSRFEHAIYCVQRAVELKPNFAAALFQLGRLLQARGRSQAALACFDEVARLTPPTIDLRIRRAASLEGVNRFDEAIALAREILKEQPTNVAAHSIIGIAYFQSARLEESEASLREALTRVDHADLHANLATALTRMGRLDEAVAEISLALQMRGDPRELAYSKSLILLFAGRLEEAWPMLEARWKHPRMDAWRYETDKPLWDGSPLDGKRILLHAEQGLGDTLMFVRYASMVAERGGKVTVEVQPGLAEVIATAPGVDRVVIRGQPPGDFDALCPLMTLPGVFRTTLATIPANVPYISTTPSRVEKWRKILGDRDDKRRVGLVWRGGDFQREDHLRSFDLATYAPLARAQNVRFYSLQKGPSASQAMTPPAGMELVNLDPLLLDFADTAAAVSLLDLVISVDTAVVHLTGALALPIWNVLARHIGHMWMTEREDSPWYPTMRIFRQAKLGEWAPTIERLAQALVEWSSGSGEAFAKPS